MNKKINVTSRKNCWGVVFTSYVELICPKCDGKVFLTEVDR